MFFFETVVKTLQKKVRVMFAGESGVDQGGPFKEFLRLSMTYINESSFVFGNPYYCFFKSDSSTCDNATYFYLGQLAAVSILEIGRGPESFHRQLVNAIFDLKVDFDDCGDDPTLDDAFYLQKVHDMKNGDKDMLLDANISESNVILAKSLYALLYSIKICSSG